jgi:hypothetical protein
MVGVTMHAPTLLAVARAVGLAVTSAGDRLVVRGPKGAAGLARLLLDRKAYVLAALAAEAPPLTRDELPLRSWTAPDLNDLERAQLSQILSAPWPEEKSLAEALEAARQHHAARGEST